jgi:acyl dehydratase
LFKEMARRTNVKHRTLWLDDLKPGQAYESGSLCVSRDDIVAFAERFDPQPFHMDEVAAKGSFFDGLAASGWHTSALSMKLLLTSPLSIGNGVISTGGELRWTKPVRPGDILKLRIAISDVSLAEGSTKGKVSAVIETLNQDDEVVQAFKTNLIVLRKPSN